MVWTAPAYIDWENKLVNADPQRQRQHEADAACPTAAIAALLSRQKQLIEPAAEFVYRETGTYPRVDDSKARDPRWAMGVPVFVSGRPYAVICPTASHLDCVGDIFTDLLVIVASNSERQRIANAAAPSQRIEVLTPAVSA